MTLASRHLIIASLPAALIGVQNLGAQIRVLPSAVSDDWRLALLAELGIGSGALATTLTGAVFWLPLLGCLLLVGFAWSLLFARSRGRPVDPVWLPTAWLFSLMLPATVPLGFAALALSFGLVFGCHVFGGSRYYLASPALLGVVFLAMAYPSLVATGAWIPGDETRTTWSIVSGSVADSTLSSNLSVLAVFLGDELGAIGTTSAAACLLGAAYLVVVSVARWQLIVGALIALAVLGMTRAQPEWFWHIAAGNFAFALAFVATDPTVKPTTSAGIWGFGALFAVLTFVIRTANPDHPEGTWAALLLASLFIPLLDYVARAITRPAATERNV